MFPFLVLSLFYTPRVRARNLTKSAHSLVCLIVSSTLAFVVEFNFPSFFSIFVFEVLNFSISRFWIFPFRCSDFELCFSSCLFLVSMRASRFLCCLVKRTACTWYIHGLTIFFFSGEDVLQSSSMYIVYYCFYLYNTFLRWLCFPTSSRWCEKNNSNASTINEGLQK